MALVRCPKHNIPYNDENPRGCPACWRDRRGGDPNADAIRELARASRALHHPPEIVPPPPPPPIPAPKRPAAARPPVTPQPRRPAVAESALQRLGRLANERRVLVLVAVMLLAVLVYLSARTSPTFVEGWEPPQYHGTVRPLPVQPGQPVTVLFAMLGPRAPRAHPDEPRLARYSYGTALFIDALNDEIYDITIGVPGWSWRGLTVGMPQRTLEGTLALLGTPRVTQEPARTAPLALRGYDVYPSLDRRPRRVLEAEVRPPNGCFDVFVDVQPRATGELVTTDRRYAVIGHTGAAIEWVSTEIRVISRSASGPGGSALC